MKKGQIDWKIIFIILIIIGGFIFFRGRLLAVTGDTFTPIYCNDYEFTCCNEKEDYISYVTFTACPLVSGDACTEYWRCPTTASKCMILDIINGFPDRAILVGKENCREENPWYAPPRWVCDDDKEYPLISTNIHLEPGTYIHNYYGVVGYSPTITVRVYKLRLDFCGKAGCTVGVPVLGADQCSFETDKSVYDSQGYRIGTGSRSYTVREGECTLSWPQGSRHICGNREEQCSTDTDCGGHTYGNQECTGRTLQTYGCRPFGSIPSEEDLNILPWEQQKDLSYGHRCEIISARTVQCCGDTDCGINAFCDTSTWTCKTTAVCSIDADCGVSEVCDFESKILKKPVCSNGQCGYQTLQNVNCCGDVDCAGGWYCAGDYTCKEKAPGKETCPFECCPAIGSDDQEKYWDRACPTGFSCDEQHKCTQELPPEEVCRKICDREFGILHPISKEICYVKCEISDFFAKNKLLIIAAFVAVFAIIALLIISRFIPMKISRRRKR